ncbi:MAG: hypothetical protein N3E41_07715 [Thermofilaceae archaeon]|nr:hypothetical protein [Thermofilaceae archaeon]
MEIERWEGAWLARENSWTLVYGRRKTGKTFLLKRNVRWEVYYTVGRSGFGILETRSGERSVVSYKEGLEAVLDTVGRGGTAVLDEFQRSPEWTWDLISTVKDEGGGRLILCGSSLGVATRVYDRRSSLLGILAPFKVDIASPSDTIASLSKHLPARPSLLWSILARDPWLLGLIKPGKNPFDELVARLPTLIPSAAGLVGEVFREEERELTRLYDATLRVLAQGYWTSGAIAQKLYEAGLLERPEASAVTGVLDQLSKMGLVERVKLWKTRHARVYYRHRSSLLSILMYVEERYPDETPPANTLPSLLGLEAQFFVGELLAEVKGLSRAYTVAREGDIDVVLMRGDTPVIGYEVKLGSISSAEAKRATDRIKGLGIPKTGLVSLTDEPDGLADEVVGPDELFRLANAFSRKRLSSLYLNTLEGGN